VGSGVTTPSNITLAATGGALTINSQVSAANVGSTVTLTSAGAISAGAVLVRGTTLILSSAGGQNLTNLQTANIQSTNTTSGATTLITNQNLTIFGTGVVNTVGNVTISTGNGSGSITLNGNVNNAGFGTILDALNGAVTQTSGAISCANLAILADFGITILNVGSTNIQAVNFTSGPVDITSSGALNFDDLTGQGAGLFSVDGNINVWAAGGITINTAPGILNGTFNGSVTLQTTGDFGASGEIDSTGDVHVIAGGDLDLSGGLFTGGLVSLQSGGNVTLGSLTGGALTVTTTNGAIAVGNGAVIDASGPAHFTATGLVTVDGDISAGATSRSATGGMTLGSSSDLFATGAVSLTSDLDMALSGAITALGGPVSAFSLGLLTQPFTGIIQGQSVSLHAMGGILTLAGNTTTAGSFVGYGLTGFTQGTTGLLSAGNVTIDSPVAVVLNTINATGSVDVQAGSGAITQSATSQVTALGSVTFQATQTILLAGVSGSTVTIMSISGAILDNNDLTIPNNLNVTASGDLILVAFTDIGSLSDPIEVQVAGLVFVGTNGGLSGHTIGLSGSSSDGKVHPLFLPPGTLIFFNGRIQVNGLTPDRMMNYYSDRTARENDVWNQDVVSDEDTSEHQLLLRYRPAPKRAKAPLR
jgi:hypothetical protein